MKLTALLLVLAACGPALPHRPVTPGLAVRTKEMSNDGRALEPWRHAAESAPRPAYIIIADANRACLVDPDTWMRTRIGDAVACKWRFPRG